MRHGDRSNIAAKPGGLDLSHLQPAWEQLMPSPEERAELGRFRVALGAQDGTNAYAKFVGTPPWGQLTSLGVAQCQRVGAELARRYPEARIRAFSTNFPRTTQSAAAVLLGFGAGSDVPITVRAPADETLLPNFDGRCKRFTRLRAERKARADEGSLRDMRDELKTLLTPVLGEDPLAATLDFRPLCIHEGSLGIVDGIDWCLAWKCEQYHASVEAHVYESAELTRLACGRLLNWMVEEFRRPEQEVVLMLAHDNMITAFLVALGIFRGEWPVYASAVVVETADFDGKLKVRTTVNDEVRRDWQLWEDFVQSLSHVVMTEGEYANVSGSEASL